MKKTKVLGHRSFLVAFLCFILQSAFLSCTETKTVSLKKQFKNNDSYFMALKALEQNDEKRAIRLFEQSTNKSNEKIARLSAEQLTAIGNAAQRLKAAKHLSKNYKDDESLLLSAEVFFNQNEYNRILALTNEINLASAPDALVSYRLECLLKKNDPRLPDELFSWFVSRALSPTHSDFYQIYLRSLGKKENSQNIPAQDLSGPDTSALPPHIQLMNYRLLVYNRNYKSAFDETDNILALYKKENRFPHYQLLSDIGKAALYGTNDFKMSAQKFEDLAATYVLAARKLKNENIESGIENKETRSSAQTPAELYELAYCAYFYAARLYDRAGRYQEKVVQRYKSALECTEDSSKFDNALWYLLNMQLRLSVDDIITTLKKYAARITDKEYFDDFFDNFSVILLSHEKWQDFYDVWKMIDSVASEETACKYAYISGRILEEGYGETDGTPKTKEAVAAYTRVLSGNSSLYYKVCALERMNIVDPTYVKDVLCSGGPEIERIEDNDAEILLAGYAAYGFPQKIYPQWLKDRDSLSMDSNIQVSKFLNSVGKFDNFYSVQSLRVAARTKTSWSGKIPYELLELNFPRFYSELVEKACAENNLSEPLLYALIRSESFFDASAGSTAGARGLTQLMPSTADDEARKLKISPDYDIFDPETNIRMGSHYYASLIGRTENNSELLAIFAYNAGLTNVRRWKRPKGMSMDLFLEILPFQETREYGRKLVSAAAMYGFLYYGTTPAETVRKLFK